MYPLFCGCLRSRFPPPAFMSSLGIFLFSDLLMRRDTQNTAPNTDWRAHPILNHLHLCTQVLFPQEECKVCVCQCCASPKVPSPVLALPPHTHTRPFVYASFLCPEFSILSGSWLGSWTLGIPVHLVLSSFTCTYHTVLLCPVVWLHPTKLKVPWGQGLPVFCFPNNWQSALR